MFIEHIAIWAQDIERLRCFYQHYFNASAGSKYRNPRNGFQSYFLTFSGGARLELMQRPDITARPTDDREQPGFAHLAFCAGSDVAVDTLTRRLLAHGFTCLNGPRRTGDGYYESVILDPEGNRIEVTG